ncbi:hypothetical protein D0469_08935 [Peribacillus saganii]|uniref:Uncharacterized protein n=1 Tax=Peribacillus saganii TaxID=2303992 RepID=A0A372LPA9_9BACI|nr:hypothetical protein [Peribacillus saganii]RFU69716.1 hypothetical protein D0469_08935 [Peribacillus saganii]
MCFSTNVIETQAYETALKIREESIFKFVRTECTNGKIFDIDNPGHAELPVITKVILQDKSGNLFAVEPNQLGLKFAKGEINFKEYKKTQKSDMAKGLGILCAVTGIFFSISVAFVQWMI